MAGSEDTFRALPRPARHYLGGVFVAAIAATMVASGHGPAADWTLVAIVMAVCAAGKAFEAFAPGHYALQPSYAALVWGCLLAPTWTAPLFAIACFAPDLRPRGGTATYKVLFNIANYSLVGMLVSVIGNGGGVAMMAAAALAAAIANHALIVVAIATTGEQPLRGTVRQITDGMPLSVGVGLTGAVLAALWVQDPALLILAAGPIGLLYRALWVPMLQHRVDTDPKTGLYHSERIREELGIQIEAGPVAVAMIDLDHLRTINSRCGHLAGDRAIRAVADELAVLAATHGAAGRFGGEEFCLVLPAFDADMAGVHLNAMLRRLEAVEFREAPDLRVSFSAGVAVHPHHGDTVDALLSAADTALYDAKASGRSRVRTAVTPAEQDALAVPPAREDAPEQPLPAASGSRLAVRMVGRNGRRTSDTPETGLARELADAHALLARTQASHLATLVSLAEALEDKDPYAVGSGRRVAAIALRLAGELGCTDADRRGLSLAAALRDIGRAGARDAVLLKGERLDPLEREEVRAQAELSSRVLADLELPAAVKHMVRSHHERWDGTGYPDRLAGEEIPLGARILAVAEALDAMLSPRPYRPALPLQTVLEELEAGAGAQFCPRVAAVAARCLEDDPHLHLNVTVHPSTEVQNALEKGHTASQARKAHAGAQGGAR